jgi:hypothetical protein
MNKKEEIKIMKNVIKGLFLSILILSVSFTQDEVVKDESVNVTGEFGTDVGFGDVNSFTSVYTGVVLSGEGWELSTNLSDGMVNVEEAKYTWAVTDKVNLVFGNQSLPYGNAWGLHRPSNNSFVSLPREHSISNGVGLNTSLYGVGVQGFYGGTTEEVADTAGVVLEESEAIWAGRVTYSLYEQTVGLSIDSNEALLLDVSSSVDVLGIPVVTSFEYDLSEEANGAFWLRSVVTPEFAKGASLLLGYSEDGDDETDSELLYGLKYKCSDRTFVTTELSSDDDLVLRVSYKF